MADTYYLLQHIATGKMMPQMMSRGGRGGWSYWQPDSPEASDHGVAGAPPRLFTTLRAASNARTMWAQGQWKRTVTASPRSYCGETDYSEEVTVDDTGRTPEQLRVVRATLKTDEVASHA